MKILVVDESKTSLLMIKAYLEKLGHEVIAINEPKKANTHFIEHQPDLIILDIIMESMSGYGCARQLRESIQQCHHPLRWVPIIFLSAQVDDDAITQGIHAGCDDYIIKPFSEITLKSKIKAMERISKMQQDLEESHAKLETLSATDSLTGISNRFNFEKNIERIFNDSKENKKRFALLFIDLDNFKIVNDTLGHQVGDKLLVEAVSRMKQSLRGDDLIARIGGDEFAVILPDLTDTNTAGDVASKINEFIQISFDLGSSNAQVTSSIGIACYPEAGNDTVSLLKNADIAMYRAKESGKNNHVYFTEKLNKKYNEKITFELCMNKALENHEFSLSYQPKFNLKTNEIVGLEALIRWQHPTMGNISPDTFIPVAEKSGLIKQIGKWVIEEACKEYRNVIDKKINHIRLAINLSPHQLDSEEILTHIETTLDLYKINPKHIEFEITETAIMHKNKISEKILKKFHNMGISLSIDDFGTGYSSLNHIKSLPIDTLKIDKEFVLDIPYDKHDVAIVKSVIVLAQSLNLNIIAEGIESKEQVDFLTKNGCYYGQGFYLSKPIPSAKLIEYFEKGIYQ